MTVRERMDTICPLFLVVLALVLAAPAVHAANGDTALGPGVWSVELGLDFDDASDPAGAISLKRHLSETAALRIGIGVQAQDQDLEGEEEDSSPVSTADVAQRSSSSQYALFLHYVRYGMLSDRVATQFSFGPVIETSRFSQRVSFEEGTPGFSESEFWQKQMTYGLEIGLGVEWFFNRRFSLGGQAMVRGLLGDMDQVQIQRSGFGPTFAYDKTELSGDVTRLETSASRIVLTGYF
jgi:hypothetical protein